MVPLPFDEIDRLTALRSYDVLDTEPEGDYDGLTKLAASIFGTPLALVSLVDEERQWFKSCYGICERQMDRQSAICAHTILQRCPLIVPDMRLDPRFVENPLVTGPMGVRFYAGVPLVDAQGFALGSLCVIDFKPQEPTQGQIETLETLARQVVALLELRRSNRALHEALDQSEKAQRRLRRKRATLETLVRVGHMVAAEFDLPRIAQTITDAASGIAECRGAAILYRFGEDGPRTCIHSEEDFDRLRPYLGDLERWLDTGPLKGGPIQDPVGQLVQLPSMAGEAPHCLGISIQSAHGDLQGGMFLLNDPVTPFDESGEDVLRRLASLAEVAFANSELVQRLSAESRERLAAEMAAKAAASRTDEVLSSISSLLVVLDGEERIVRWNATATRLLGVAGEDALGRRLDELPIPWVGQAVLDAVRAVLKDGSPQRLDDVPVETEGARRLLGISMTPLNYTGEFGVLLHAADVTARREAEEALRRQEREYRSVVENVSDVIFMTDVEGRWRFLNPAWERLTGYPVEESLGERFDELVPSGERERCRAEIRECIQGKLRGENVVIRLKHREGSDRWAQLRTEIVRDGEGRAIGATGTLHDVTDRHLAEAAERLRRRFEQVITSLFTKFINLSPKEADQVIQEALEQVATLTDMDSATLNIVSADGTQSRVEHEWGNGRHSVREGRTEWREFCDPGFVERVAEGGALLLSEGPTDSSAVSLRLASRGEFLGWLTFAKAGPLGTLSESVETLLRMVADILANALHRMRTEEEVHRLGALALAVTESRLQTVVTSAPIALFSLDSTGLFTLADGKGLDALGLDPGQVVGLRPEAVFGDETEMRQALQRAGHGEAFTQEVTIGDICFESHFCPLQDDGGGFSGTIGVLIDVTERHQLEIQLHHAQKMESIGNLTAGIAHEINTPIQYVGSNLEFLKETFEALAELDEPIRALVAQHGDSEEVGHLAREYARIAEKIDHDYLRDEAPKAVLQSIDGVSRVSEIVRSMKEFSHPGTAEKVPVDLNRSIESTITVCRNEWKYVADVVTHFDPNLGPVLCLPSDFNQAVLNILVNAAHAIESVVEGTEEKGTITVSTARVDEYVEVRIADTGTGIPEAIRDRIFNPFFTTKEVGRGTGQGLSIVHSIIVKRHGGTVQVESFEGKGTVFVLKIPAEEGCLHKD